MRENHILIIDDDLMLLKTAEEILSDQYNVSVAKSGIQALNLLNKNIIPDLILLDIDMPQMDGYETLEEIKKEVKPSIREKLALNVAKIQREEAERKQLNKGRSHSSDLEL